MPKNSTTTPNKKREATGEDQENSNPKRIKQTSSDKPKPKKKETATKRDEPGKEKQEKKEKQTPPKGPKKTPKAKEQHKDNTPSADPSPKRSQDDVNSDGESSYDESSDSGSSSGEGLMYESSEDEGLGAGGFVEEGVEDPESDGEPVPQGEALIEPMVAAAAKLRVLRFMQTTYKVCLNSCKGPGQGYDHSLSLIWDEDRFWGRFRIDGFKGIMLIDPGPDDDYERIMQGAEKPPSFSFLWRGTSSRMPKAVFNSKFTTGEIQFWEDTVTGHFDSMTAIDNPCQFTGQDRQVLDRRQCSVQRYITEWNKYSCFMQAEETIHLSSSCKKLRLPDSERPEPQTPESNWPVERQRKFVKLVTGAYKIRSTAIQQRFPQYDRKLSVFFHVDYEQNVVWGRFNMGICEGYILFHVSPDGVDHDTMLRFRWRAQETDTKTFSSSTGCVWITESHVIRGTFHDMGGDVDFMGSKNPRLEEGSSGYEPSFYCKRWKRFGKMVLR